MAAGSSLYIEWRDIVNISCDAPMHFTQLRMWIVTSFTRTSLPPSRYRTNVGIYIRTLHGSFFILKLWQDPTKTSCDDHSSGFRKTPNFKFWNIAFDTNQKSLNIYPDYYLQRLDTVMKENNLTIKLLLCPPAFPSFLRFTSRLPSRTVWPIPARAGLNGGRWTFNDHP